MRPETRLLKDFFSDIEFSFVRIRVGGRRLATDIPGKIIYIPSTWFYDDIDHIVLSWAKEIYKKRKFKIDISMRTFSILHELGHIMSLFCYKKISTALTFYEKGARKLYEEDLTPKQHFLKYRELKLERLADDFAYLVYRNYKNKVIELDKQLKSLKNTKKQSKR
jgi:hypothetical protein